MRLVPVWLLMALITPVAAFAEDAEYANIFDGKGAVLGVGEKGVRLTDLISPVQYCKPSDKYACVISKPLVFAIPRIGSEETKSWSYTGARYKVMTVGEMTVLGGKSIPYRVIRQRWNGLVVDYAYSDEYGVVAIRASGGQQLMLLGKCGFAAISDKSGCLGR